MFCCFRGALADSAERTAQTSVSGPTERNETPNNSLGGESGKATAVLEVIASPLSERFTKGSRAGATCGGVATDAVQGRSAEPAQQLNGIWSNLVEGLHTNAGKQSGVAGSGCAQGDGDALRLPPVGGVVSLHELQQQLDALSDPAALVTFDRASKRLLRSQRVSPNLVMDINLEALFAGGVVFPPCPTDTCPHSLAGSGLGGQQQQPLLSGAQDTSGGLLPPPGVLHLLQRSYCTAEAIRLSVRHSNAALQWLLGCGGGSPEYEELLAELLSGEHMMRAVLHDCCLCMLEGVAASSAQLMVHHPLRSTSSRMVLPLSLHPVLVWMRPPHPLQPGHAAMGAASIASVGGGGSGRPLLPPLMPEVPVMGLVVRYPLSAGLQDALQQLHRVYAMLSSLSGIVTLFTLRGKVLHQNTASVRYMGLRAGAAAYGSAGGGLIACSSTGTDIQQSTDMTDASGLAVGSLLRQIFALSSEQLDDMLEDVVEGKTWKGIVRVPPLLTPTIDPGPAQAAVLLARGASGMTVGGVTPLGSNAQVMTTWERLGPVLMSTQPGVRQSMAQAGAQSDADGHSEINIALMLTAGKSLCGPNDGASVSCAGGCSSTAPGGTVAALRAANASTQGGGAGGTSRYGNGGGTGAGNLGDTSSTPDSLFLAMGSTSGTTFSRTHLGTQGSSLRMNVQQRTFMGRMSSNDLPEGAALAGAMSAPGAGAGAAGNSGACAGGAAPGAASVSTGGTGAYFYTASKLSGSAPLVPPSNAPRATVSAARVAGTSLLRTLMENGSSIMSEMDRASISIGAVGGGISVGGLLSAVSPVAGGVLTDAARQSIIRRRSALRLAPSTSDDNPLSTSTWGLFDSARRESKSFSVRRHNTPPSYGFPRTGTEKCPDRAAPSAGAPPAQTEPQTHAGSTSGVASSAVAVSAVAAPAAGASSAAGIAAGSLTSGGGTNKKRPPSRLMSFLANKNIGGAPMVAGGGSGRSATNVWSASVVGDNGGFMHCGGGAGAGALLKGVSSTTELEVGSRQGSSLCGGRGGLQLLGIQQQHMSTAAGGGGSGGTTADTPPETSGGGGSGTFRRRLLVAEASIGGGGSGCSVFAQPPSLLAAAAAAAATAAATAASPRRAPTRRLMRPFIEDVAEESGGEVSARLAPPAAAVAVAAAGDSSSSAVVTAAPTALPSQISAALQVSRASTASQVRGPTAGQQLLQPSQAGRSCASDGGFGEDDEEDCWHEITASTLRDPVGGEQALLLMQVDVSARVRAERRIAEVLEAEHKLLESVFPRHVLELAASRCSAGGPTGRSGLGGISKFSLAELPLAQKCASVATYHPQVTILFSDIIGFTSMCHEIPATKVMEFLNNLYSRLDTLLDVYGVYKVETIGDCYMVAGGLMTRDADGFMTVRGSDSLDELHAAKVMSFAKAMLRETAEVLLPTTGEPVQMRIGLHSGPVMSGIVGSKMPRFCLFGDTVNTASRMESTCPPGCIHVSAATRDCLPDEDWEPTGGVMVKGKGTMETFRWVPLDTDASPSGRGIGGGGGGQQRHNRPRRASSIAYIHTSASIGGGGTATGATGGGGGVLSRDGSGHVTLAQQLTHAAAAGSGPMGLASGPGSTVGNSNSTNALLPAAGCRHGSVPSAPPPYSSAAAAMGSKAHRAASATIAFTAAVGGVAARATGSGVVTLDGGSGSPASGGLVASAGVSSRGGGGGAGGLRRKLHRSCSTTVLAYKGMSRPN